jgi:hypothetical protein
MTVPPLFDAHHRLTRELKRFICSSGSVSRLLLLVSCSPHTTRVERDQTFPSHELLFRTDDLSSQHREDSTDPDLLNQEAAALGLSFNPVPPAFLTFEPIAFPQPFDARDTENGSTVVPAVKRHRQKCEYLCLCED